MAKGGWSYGQFRVNPHTNNSTEWEADWDGVSDAITGLGVGWTIDQANTKYLSYTGGGGAWWRSWVHGTTNARIVFCVSTERSSSTGNFMLSSNNQSNQSLTSTSCENHMGFAYIPPSIGGVGPGTPYSADFIPDGGFRFLMHGYDDTTSPLAWNPIYDGSNGSMTFHFIGKDDDIVILFENRSDTGRGLDSLWIMGTFIGALEHPSEETNAALAQECLLGCGRFLTGFATALNSEDSPVEFYRTPGVDGGDPPTVKGRRRVDGSFIYWNTVPLDSTNINDHATSQLIPYVDPMLYFADNDAIDTNGVIPGNGLKGRLDPEKLRVIDGSSFVQGQTFDGGNFLYVGGDLLVPWDAANPPIF